MTSEKEKDRQRLKNFLILKVYATDEELPGVLGFALIILALALMAWLLHQYLTK
jgi:hypothetical protein